MINHCSYRFRIGILPENTVMIPGITLTDEDDRKKRDMSLLKNMYIYLY